MSPTCAHSARRPAPRLHAGSAALLVALLLVLQTLGLMHGVAHGALHRWQPAATGSFTAASATPTAGVAAGSTWVDQLFAGHDKGSACSLFDQLLQPDLLVDHHCSAAPAIAEPPPAEVHRAWQLALQAHGFLARGPPSRR